MFNIIIESIVIAATTVSGACCDGATFIADTTVDAATSVCEFTADTYTAAETGVNGIINDVENMISNW